MAGVKSQLGGGFLGGAAYSQLSGSATPGSGAPKSASLPLQSTPVSSLVPRTASAGTATAAGTSEEQPSHSIEQIAGEIEVALRREVGATRSALETLFARKEQATGSAAAAGSTLPAGIASLSASGGGSAAGRGASRSSAGGREERGGADSLSSSSGVQPKSLGAPSLSQMPQDLQALVERVSSLEQEQRATSATAFARMDQIEARFAAEILEMQRQIRKTSQEQQRAQTTGSDVGSSHPVEATRSEDDNMSVRSLALSSQTGRNNTDEIKSRLLEVRRHAEGLLSSSPTTRSAAPQIDLRRSLLEALAELPQNEVGRARSEASAPAGLSYQRNNTEALIAARAEQLGTELRADLCDRVNAAHASLREDVSTAVERMRQELKPRLEAVENCVRQMGLDPAPPASEGARARSPALLDEKPLVSMSSPAPPGGARPKITRDMKESLSRLVSKVNHTLSVEPSTRASEVDENSQSRQSSAVGSSVPRRSPKAEGTPGSMSGSRSTQEGGSAINDISSAIRALGVNSPEAMAQEALGVMRQHSAHAAQGQHDSTPRGISASATPDAHDSFRNMAQPPPQSRSVGHTPAGLQRDTLPLGQGTGLGPSSCNSSVSGSTSTKIGPNVPARETLLEHAEVPSAGSGCAIGSPSRGGFGAPHSGTQPAKGPSGLRQAGSVATPAGMSTGGAGTSCGGNGLGPGRSSSPNRPGQPFGQRPLLSPAGLGIGTSQDLQQPPPLASAGIYNSSRSTASSNLSQGGARSPLQNPYAARR